jgi:hypothetical protein
VGIRGIGRVPVMAGPAMAPTFGFSHRQTAYIFSTGRLFRFLAVTNGCQQFCSSLRGYLTAFFGPMKIIVVRVLVFKKL